MKKPEIKLIKNWGLWWRTMEYMACTYWNINGYFTPEIAEALTYVWNNLPLDIKTTFPSEWVKGWGMQSQPSVSPPSSSDKESSTNTEKVKAGYLTKHFSLYEATYSATATVRGIDNTPIS